MTRPTEESANAASKGNRNVPRSIANSSRFDMWKLGGLCRKEKAPRSRFLVN